MPIGGNLPGAGANLTGGFSGGRSGGSTGGRGSSIGATNARAGGGRAAQLTGLTLGSPRSIPRGSIPDEIVTDEMRRFQEVLRRMLLGEAGGGSLL
jgi:hypothetical protein